MADILERIRNPIARGATAALIGASIATIVTGGVLGLSKLETRLVHRYSLYAGLAGIGIGALWGGLVVKPAADKTASKTATASSDSPPKAGDD